VTLVLKVPAAKEMLDFAQRKAGQVGQACAATSIWNWE